MLCSRLARAALPSAVLLACSFYGMLEDATALSIIDSSGDIDLVVSDPFPVGTGVGGDLVQVTLSAVSRSGGDIVGFAGEIGSSGFLHHEQFRGGPPFFPRVSTPTAASAGDSSVDSHFVVALGETRIAALEQTGEDVDDDGFVGTPSGEPGDFRVGGFVGFGPSLSGDFDFAESDVGSMVELAQVVVRFRVAVLDLDELVDAAITVVLDPEGEARVETFTFGVIPEPSSGLLAVGPLAWLCCGRRKN